MAENDRHRMTALLYWLIFLTTLVACLVPTSLRSKAMLVALAGILIVFVGLRHEVGGDWYAYLGWLDEARGVPFSAVMKQTDISYAAINWLAANSFGGIYLANLICAAAAVGGLTYFCSQQRDPFLALAVAVPYLIIVVFMGYTRQAAAIGIGAAAFSLVSARRPFLFLFAVLLATSLHKSAAFYLLFSPVLLTGRISLRNFGYVFATLFLAGVVCTWLFWDSLIHLIYHYWWATGELTPSQAAAMTEASGRRFENLTSAGAVPRLLQQFAAVLAFIIIVWRGVPLSRAERILWGVASTLSAFLLVLALFRSTLADRTALFLYPLQLFAFSVLPLAFPLPWSRLVKAAILFALAASLWVWLEFSANARHWLPYQTLISHPWMP